MQLAVPIMLVGAFTVAGVALVWIGLSVESQRRASVAHAEETIAPFLMTPEQELQAPFNERVLRPFIRNILRRLGAISPGRNLENLRRQLLIAGSPLGLGPLDFIGLRFLVLLVGIGTLVFLVLPSTMAPLRQALVVLFGSLVCAELPRLWLRNRMARRKKSVTLALPDALDMLTVCVDAGMALEAAFLRIGQVWRNALAQELVRVVEEMGMGVSWREAMRNMVYRTDVPDLASLVAVLLQADQLGFSIADTLHAQAEQLRTRRWQRAQEAARSAPFKMLFPMVFFILPATFAVILGPAIPAILRAFGR